MWCRLVIGALVTDLSFPKRRCWALWEKPGKVHGFSPEQSSPG